MPLSPASETEGVFFQMFPNIFELFGVSPYSLLLVFGCLIGWGWTRFRARNLGIAGRHIDNIVLIAVPGGLFGARVVGRAFYSSEPLSFWQSFCVWDGGAKVFYGGLIAGIICVLVYSRLAKLDALQLGDAIAPGIATGLALGRLGCFMVGCCWGDVCVDSSKLALLNSQGIRKQIQTFPAISGPHMPLAVRFPTNSWASKQHQSLGLLSTASQRSLPVHPVQLYEAFAIMTVGIILAVRRSRPGETILILGIVYGTLRFVLEYLRADNIPKFSGMTVSQIISLGLIFTCLFVFIFQRHCRRPRGTRFI